VASPSRVLITGASGFAGRHLVDACAAGGDEVVTAPPASAADLRDAGATRRVVAGARPDVVYHLAAQAHVGRSWEDPAGTVEGNLAMTLNVLEAVRAEAPDAVVLLIGSGEVYGPPDTLPTSEDALLSPQNPYAVSKASGDLLGGMYADAHGLRVVRARAFNHSGPGQEPIYAIANFAKQVAAGIDAGEDPVNVVIGNPDTRRDFTDVRDIVRAYRMLAARGESGPFNVCSGVAHSARELLATLERVTGVRVGFEVDPARVRAHEVMEVRGSFERLREATGWEPEIPLEKTLADSVEYWRATLA
jgi:GDP-4-dehydro-6-deoxy-D-mannose reductase